MTTQAAFPSLDDLARQAERAGWSTSEGHCLFTCGSGRGARGRAGGGRRAGQPAQTRPDAPLPTGDPGSLRLPEGGRAPGQDRRGRAGSGRLAAEDVVRDVGALRRSPGDHSGGGGREGPGWVGAGTLADRGVGDDPAGRALPHDPGCRSDVDEPPGRDRAWVSVGPVARAIGVRGRTHRSGREEGFAMRVIHRVFVIGLLAGLATGLAAIGVAPGVGGGPAGPSDCWRRPSPGGWGRGRFRAGWLKVSPIDSRHPSENAEPLGWPLLDRELASLGA